MPQPWWLGKRLMVDGQIRQGDWAGVTRKLRGMQPLSLTLVWSWPGHHHHTSHHQHHLLHLLTYSIITISISIIILIIFTRIIRISPSIPLHCTIIILVSSPHHPHYNIMVECFQQLLLRLSTIHYSVYFIKSVSDLFIKFSHKHHIKRYHLDIIYMYRDSIMGLNYKTIQKVQTDITDSSSPLPHP